MKYQHNEQQSKRKSVNRPIIGVDLETKHTITQ